MPLDPVRLHIIESPPGSPSKPSTTERLHGDLGMRSGRDKGALAPGLRMLGIVLKGNGVSKQQKTRLIPDLLQGAAQVMIAKGFDPVERGVQIEGLREVHGEGPTKLTFPCSLGALSFYLLPFV